MTLDDVFGVVYVWVGDFLRAWGGLFVVFASSSFWLR